VLGDHTPVTGQSGNLRGVSVTAVTTPVTSQIIALVSRIAAVWLARIILDVGPGGLRETGV